MQTKGRHSIQICFYGKVGDRLGRSVELDLPEAVSTIADLRRLLEETFPDAADELACDLLKACVGDQIVGEAHDIRQVGAVEFFPPVSGG